MNALAHFTQLLIDSVNCIRYNQFEVSRSIASFLAEYIKKKYHLQPLKLSAVIVHRRKVS